MAAFLEMHYALCYPPPFGSGVCLPVAQGTTAAPGGAALNPSDSTASSPVEEDDAQSSRAAQSSTAPRAPLMKSPSSQWNYEALANPNVQTQTYVTSINVGDGSSLPADAAAGMTDPNIARNQHRRLSSFSKFLMSSNIWAGDTSNNNNAGGVAGDKPHHRVTSTASFLKDLGFGGDPTDETFLRNLHDSAPSYGGPSSDAPMTPSAVAEHHRRLSSFSSMLMAAAGQQQQQQQQGGDASQNAGSNQPLSAKAHHRVTSSTAAFLKELGYGGDNSDAAFLRNLHECAPSYGGPPSADASTLPGEAIRRLSESGLSQPAIRRLSSFSNLLMGLSQGGALVDGSSPDAATGGAHHRNTSSTASFLQDLGFGGDKTDAAFLRNLKETAPSYGQPTMPTNFEDFGDVPASLKFGFQMPASMQQQMPASMQQQMPASLQQMPISADSMKSSESDDGEAQGAGNKRVRRKCTTPGCPNRVVQGGLCISHGAKRKTCKHPKCNKNVKKAGLCSTHGPARKRCGAPGCKKVAVQGGCCIAHGAKKRLCSIGECKKQAILAGMCRKHHEQLNGLSTTSSRQKSKSDSSMLEDMNTENFETMLSADGSSENTGML